MDETKEQKGLKEIYKTMFTPNYDSDNYAEAYKLLTENLGLEEYLNNSQAINMIKYMMIKNNADITEIKSSLEKTLDLLEKN
jgi:hypothetical protein